MFLGLGYFLVALIFPVTRALDDPQGGHGPNRLDFLIAFMIFAYGANILLREADHRRHEDEHWR